jgi:hypothetical protein
MFRVHRIECELPKRKYLAAEGPKALRKQFAPIGTPAIAGLEEKLVVGYILH